MKRLLASLMFMTAVVTVFMVNAEAFPGDPRNPDSINYISPLIKPTSIMYSLDSKGNILPGRYDQNIGSTTHVWDKLYVREINVTNGLIAVKEHFQSIPASSETGHRSIGISTTALFAQGGTTWITSDITQSTVPRNVVIFSSFTAGMSTTIITAQMIIRGIDSTGRSTSETLSFTTSPTFGVLAWALISSVTVTGSSISEVVADPGLVLKMGTTNSIGLTNVIVSTGDVYKLVEGSQNVLLYAPNNSNVIISTNNTFVPLNVPNGSTFERWIWYRTKRTSPY